MSAKRLEIDPRARRVPHVPARGERLKVLIDSDAKNEIDDQWAIALAILSPERFEIEGFVAANFDNERGGPGGIEASAREIELIIDKVGMSGRWPVLCGSHPLQYREQPTESEGVDFIIERALAATPEEPLWIVGLGAATDMASAYLKAPEIVDRVIAFWHLRTRWPEKCWNFNVFGDVRAARLLFHSPLSFVLFDTGTHLTCPMEESERRVKPYGELGEYLHEYRRSQSGWMSAEKGFFDLGDIAALLDPELATWEEVDCPAVDQDLSYQFEGKLGRILRCSDIDREATFALLFEKMEAHYSA